MRQSAWIGRLLRGRRLDRNPLRRRSDRIETIVLGLLLAVFAGGAPVAAHAAGSVTYAASAREAQAQQTVSHQVPATLLQAVPEWGVTGYEAVPEVAARWTAPDGQVRTGLVVAENGLKAGNIILLWVNQAGQITQPPLQPGQIGGRAQLAESLAVFALAMVLLIAAGLARRSLDRRRLAAWDADWMANGPRWTPRR